VRVENPKGSISLRGVQIDVESDFPLTTQERASLSSMLEGWVQSICSKQSAPQKNIDPSLSVGISLSLNTRQKALSR
jgi:hypothetical protein